VSLLKTNIIFTIVLRVLLTKYFDSYEIYIFRPHSSQHYLRTHSLHNTKTQPLYCNQQHYFSLLSKKKIISQKMINPRLLLLFSSIFFLIFISSSLLFATPSFAARVGHSLVQEEVTKTPQYKKIEEPEIPEEPELPLPEEPEIPEEPEVPEIPEEPEEPEEPPKEQEESSFGFPSWIPSFPFPGVNGGFPKTETKKPTATVVEVPAKSTIVSEEISSGSNKKP
ncbi:unnamed protein product, partial [Thlaspi arvense]